jgi:hypothetical protein
MQKLAARGKHRELNCRRVGVSGERGKSRVQLHKFRKIGEDFPTQAKGRLEWATLGCGHPSSRRKAYDPTFAKRGRMWATRGL